MKLTHEYQDKWKSNNLFDPTFVENNLSEKIKLHQAISSTLSSAAACLNVLGNMNTNIFDLKNYLNSFGLGIEEILPFPSGAEVVEEIYDDKGPLVFEWIGPKQSPLYESSGGRGHNRTSVDAYVLALIENKVTQIFIEWKFDESYGGRSKFSGDQGIERLRRYSSVLSKMRRNNPFNINDKSQLGLYDLGYEPFYQLLRITLLARTTTPIKINDYLVEDYRVVQLTHSHNKKLNKLGEKHTIYTPGLRNEVGKQLHDVWANTILSPAEREHFKFGYWDKGLVGLTDGPLKQYLIERYH
jgi:hypothetical protein